MDIIRYLMKNKGYILAAVLLLNAVHAINYSVNAICVKETGSLWSSIIIIIINNNNIYNEGT